MDRKSRSTGRPLQGRVRMGAQERRTQILKAASRIISERGYWGLSLRDVALDCDITEAGVLHHVGSKARLLVTVLEFRDDQDRRALGERLGVPTEDLDAPVPRFGLDQLCRAAIARNSEQREVVRLYSVLSGESLEPSHPAHEYFEERESRTMKLASKAALVDGHSEADAVHVARAALSALDGLQLRWLRDNSGFDLAEEWDAISRVAFAGARSRYASRSDPL